MTYAQRDPRAGCVGGSLLDKLEGLSRIIVLCSVEEVSTEGTNNELVLSCFGQGHEASRSKESPDRMHRDIFVTKIALSGQAHLLVLEELRKLMNPLYVPCVPPCSWNCSFMNGIVSL